MKERHVEGRHDRTFGDTPIGVRKKNEKWLDSCAAIFFAFFFGYCKYNSGENEEYGDDHHL